MSFALQDEGIKSIGNKKYVSMAAVRVIDTDDTDETDSDTDGKCKLLAFETDLGTSIFDSIAVEDGGAVSS